MQLNQRSHEKALVAQLRLKNFRDKELHDPWQIYWTTEKRFSPYQSKKVFPNINENNILSLSFNLPPGVRKLRIDPPSFTRFTLFRPEIISQGQAGQTSSKLWEIPLGLNHMGKKDDKLEITEDEDPYFYWDMPKKVSKTDGIVVFKAEIRRR